jgi:hypothetical protein
MAALINFQKFVFHVICVLLAPNKLKEKLKKNIESHESYAKKLILIHHLGSIHHFWYLTTDMSWSNVAGQKKLIAKV